MKGLRREQSCPDTKVCPDVAAGDGSLPNCSRVRVFARVRPPNEADQGAPCNVVDLDEARHLVRVVGSEALEKAQREKEQGVPETAPEMVTSPNLVEAREFAFDGAFGPSCSQEDVFKAVGRPVLQDCLAGINGTVLAYGQTGSGKTYSLQNPGPKANRTGLLPRLVADLFALADTDTSSVLEIEAAALQIYNEQVDDLLHPDYLDGKGWNLNVIEGGSVPGLTWLRCSRPDQLLAAFAFARTNLVYAETKLNKASSRSHAVFQVRVRRQDRARAGPGGLINRHVEYTSARLSIVDLAGSERVKKSGAEGVQFREATMINRSLLSLGNVVSALAAKKAHVPLRDSKLTRILDGSIGGNCRTVLLVCVSPSSSNAQESVTSLEFASRAMRVEVNARVNKCMVELDANGGDRSARPERSPQPLTAEQEAALAAAAAQERMAQRLAASEAALAEAAEERSSLVQEKAEIEQRCKCWEERAGSLEEQMRRLEEESRQLHEALGRAEKRAAELRISAGCKGEESEAARKAVVDAEARAARAEERAILAVSNLEEVRRVSNDGLSRAEAHARGLEEQLRDARHELAAKAASESSAVAAERDAATKALRQAAVREEGLRGECDEAQRQLQETQSQLATARHELSRHSTALDAARKELAIHRMESATRESELQEKFRQAVKAGEDLTMELKRESHRAAAAEEAYRKLNEGASEKIAAAAALEAQAALEAAEWVGEREGLEAAHQHLIDSHRADWRARMRDKRGDWEGRISDLKRESAYLRRRLEAQSVEHTEAEARWKRAKEDAVKEEREHNKAQKRKAEAAFKAERDTSAKREAELLEAHAKLARQLSERDNGDKDFVISQQQTKIEELRWELERRQREEERLRQELRAQDRRECLGVQGFAPPLPGQKSGLRQRPASAGKMRSGPRGWSASPRESPIKGFSRGSAVPVQTENTDRESATSSPGMAGQSPRHSMPNLSPMTSPVVSTTSLTAR